MSSVQAQTAPLPSVPKTGFLTDCNGKASHTRLLVMLTIPLLVLIPLGAWAYLVVAKVAMVAIDPTVPLYVGSATSIVLGYAGYKSYNEPVAPPPVAKTQQ